MNTPRESQENLYNLKKAGAEIVFILSIAWSVNWLWGEANFVFVLVSLLIASLFSKRLKVSLKAQYVLSSLSLTMAVLVSLIA